MSGPPTSLKNPPTPPFPETRQNRHSRESGNPAATRQHRHSRQPANTVIPAKAGIQRIAPTMTCYNCGQTIAPNARFCSGCGQSQPDAASPYPPGGSAPITRQHSPNSSLSNDHRRQEILEQSVMDAISKGWKIESQGKYHAVIVEGGSVNHLLHLILSILTSGIWIIVWFLLVVFGGQRRRMIYVNEQGYISVTKA